MIHPWLSRQVVYPLHERLMKRPTMAYLAELERTQWLPRAEIERLQMQGAQRLLRLAALHCPWHAARIQAGGLDVSREHGELSMRDLRRIPTMTKQDARTHVATIRWDGVPGGAQKYNTGGSSGEPLIFYFGRRRQASDAAGRIRARRWWGVELGDREVYLWGAPTELSKTDNVKTVRDRLLNQLLLNAFSMSVTSMDAYLDAIEEFQPKCIYGYASSIALLAARARANGRRPRLRSLRAVCTTGEPLYPHQRSLIEDVFGVSAANEFGSRDIGFTAHETPSGQMLLMSEGVLLEVLGPDGSPVRTGDLGEAVITGLCSDAQPFIRYRTGDIVRISDQPCRDGRGLHVIDEVIGRTTDFVVRSDGVVMHALAVIYVIRANAGIEAFKFIQHGVSDVELLIVKSPMWSDSSHQLLTQGLKDRLGEDLRVVTRFVDEIPAGASGKYRYVVSHVPLPAGVGPEIPQVRT